MSANPHPTRLAPAPPPGPSSKGRTPLGVKNVQSRAHQNAQEGHHQGTIIIHGGDGGKIRAAPVAPEDLKPLPMVGGPSPHADLCQADGHSHRDNSCPKSHRMSFLSGLQRSKVFNNFVGGDRLLHPPSCREDQPGKTNGNGLGTIMDANGAVDGGASVSRHNLIGSLRTPKKRAIPREDIHPRNVVDTEDGSPPHKKSRSSKDSGSDSTGGASLPAPQTDNFAIGMASAVDKLQVGLSAPIGTPPPTPVLPAAAELGCYERPRPQTAQGISYHNVAAATTTASKLRSGREPHNVPRSPREVPPQPKIATTQRIDNVSRMSAAERAARDEQKRRQAETWKRKYTAEFPNMTFYLDGFDDKTKGQLTRTITGLGGKVEPFFSNVCTHLLSKHLGTPADLAAESIRQCVARPTRLKTTAAKAQTVVKATKRFSPSKKGVARRNEDLPLHSDRNPFEDNAPLSPALPSHGVIAKASDMGLHVWPLDKFWQIANLLHGQDVTQQPRQSKADLAQLLRHEQLHGTSERDINAPREGWKYFDKDAIYIFIEDATREHRAIMAHQFERPSDSQSELPWPKLYGEAENRCPFSKTSARARERDRTLVGPRRTEGGRARSIQRLHSPMPLAASRDQRGASPFQQLASGNSVSLASHMTTSAIGTPSTSGFAGGYHGLVGPQDKRVAQLNRRMVSAGAVDLLSATAFGEDRLRESPSGPHARGAFVRSLLGMKDDHSQLHPSISGSQLKPQPRIPHTPQARHHHDLSHRSVSLQRPSFRPPPMFTTTQPGMTRSVSLGTGTSIASHIHSHSAQGTLQEVKSFVPVNERIPAPGSVEALVGQLRQRQLEVPEAVIVQKREDPNVNNNNNNNNNERRPYCENCRVYFDDLEEHTQSNRHRKFALNSANFTQIDALFRRVERPQAPWVPFIADWLSQNAMEALQQGKSVVVPLQESDGYSSTSRAGSEDPPLSIIQRADIYVAGDEGDGETLLAEQQDETMNFQSQPQTSFYGMLDPDVARQMLEAKYLPGPAVDGGDIEADMAEESLDYNTSFVETEGHITPRTSPEASARQESVFSKDGDDEEDCRGRDGKDMAKQEKLVHRIGV